MLNDFGRHQSRVRRVFPRAENRKKAVLFQGLAVTAAILVVAILAGCERKSDSVKGGKQGRGGGSNAPVAAIIGTVMQKDVPIYLDGLGTVQAFNSVMVRSRVDGELKKLSFKEGQDVEAGQLLAQIDPDPFRTQVEQLEAKKAQDEAQLQFARVELKRNADLLVQKIVSQEVYDTQKAQVDQLVALVKSDQASIDNSKVQLNYTTIEAPISGRTGIRFVDEGNIIHSGDSNGIVVLTQLKPISVIFTLPEQSLREIQRQQAQGAMTVIALDRDNSTPLDEGQLAVFDNQIDTTTGTIRLKATFPNANLKLWPGQFVNSRLLLSIRTNGIVVPASVVQRGPEGAYAFVVNNDMSVKMAPVKVAQIDQGQALIDSGLTAGDRVVVDGQYKLQPGSKVRSAEAPDQKPSGGKTNVASKSKSAENGKGHKGQNEDEAAN
jgi:multidrug efflux system membrane fusion protein